MLLTASLMLLAASPAPLKVALMPLAPGDGVPEKTVASMTDALAAELRQIAGLQIVTGDELSAVVSMERQKALAGCQNDSCMAEVAGALDADRIVIGNVAKLGQSWIVHLQLVDSKKVVTLTHSDRRKKGGSIDDVLDALPGMARELFGTAAVATPVGAPASQVVPVAPAVGAPPPVSTAEVPSEDVDRTKLQVVEDDAGHTLVFQPFAGFGPLYYGAGETFYAQRVFGGGSEGTKRFNWVFWEPRARSPSQASFDFKDGAYSLTCGKRVIPLKPVPDPRTRALLKKARLMSARWARHAYALARDEEGNYYYVDQAREPEDNKDFRVYLGTQGEMAAVPTKVLASDNKGDVFGTPSGKLRFSHGQREAEWIAPGGRNKLEYLEVQDNARLVYGALGVYKNQSLGTPCDGLL